MAELANYDIGGEEMKIKTLIVIGGGFESQLRARNNMFVPVDVYSSVDSFGLAAVIAGASSHNAIGAVNSVLSGKLYEIYGGDQNIKIDYIKHPVYANNFTYLNNRIENVSAGMVLGFVSSQTVFLPIIIFVIIMMSTQLLAASIFSEKNDKTLETLMTVPMNRMSVLFAKILSASIYAGIYTAAYSISYMRFTGSFFGGGNYPENLLAALENFGITFDAAAFAVIGLQLFLSVLCGLAVSMLIGMMTEDIKTLQAYMMPLVFIVMTPYIISMFTDINTLPVIVQVIMYIIPFTHTFTAAANLFVQNYAMLAFGIIYQAVFVAVLLTLAVKIFNSDKLFTLGQFLQMKPRRKKKMIAGK
jgi:ABC-2 type transport system permease protein